MRYIDLTHAFVDDMPVYPGDPKSELKQIADIPKDGYIDHMLHSAMHVGTHIDAPLHMLADGKKITDFPPEKFFGKGILVDARGKSVIEPEDFADAVISKGDIVLFFTGFSEKFRENTYYENHPDITPAAAQALAATEASIVGMDMPSPDKPPFETHKILLGKEILIIENLTNLDQLMGVKDFEIIALPANFSAEAAPVRVIAKIT